MKSVINIITGEETQYPLSAEELAAQAEYLEGEPERARKFAEESVRADRDSRLALTDFYALSDTVMSEAMTTYRQALRDIPAQAGFPNSITWPESP
jgi:hypothetical protein